MEMKLGEYSSFHAEAFMGQDGSGGRGGGEGEGWK